EPEEFLARCEREARRPPIPVRLQPEGGGLPARLAERVGEEQDDEALEQEHDEGDETGRSRPKSQRWDEQRVRRERGQCSGEQAGSTTPVPRREDDGRRQQEERMVLAEAGRERLERQRD